VKRLHDYLEMNGPIASSKVKEEGKKAGHSEAALQRARKRLQVHVDQGGYPRVTFWSLPDGTQSAQSLQVARGEETTTTTSTTSSGSKADDTVVPVVAVVASPRARKPTKVVRSRKAAS